MFQQSEINTPSLAAAVLASPARTRTRSSFLFTLILLLLFCQSAQSALSHLPGLYMDRITLLDSSSQYTPGGRSYLRSFSEVLPGVISSGVSVLNFETGKNRVLSFMVLTTSISTTQSSVRVILDGSISHMLMMKFTRIVNTVDTNEIELAAVSLTYRSFTWTSDYVDYTSTKFNFATSVPHIQYFHSWIVADNNYGLYQTEYWNKLTITTYSSTNKIRVTCSSGSMMYLTDVGIILLLVAKVDMGNGFVPSVYSTISIKGSSSMTGYTTVFTNNFGIDTALYGAEDSGACLHGIIDLDLIHSSNPSNLRKSYFIFNYWTTEVTALYIAMGGIKMSTFCYGYTCSTGIPSGTGCSSCPYDCLTCSSATVCLTCDSAAFRALDSNTSRCLPIAGYFDNNVTVCESCPSQCSLCSSLTVCSACVSPYFLNTTSSFCETCPYDCLTCGTDGVCLTCDSANHFRELSGSRCVPLAGYFDNGVPVCESCPNVCSACSSLTVCSACVSPYFLNTTSSFCETCPYDCLTCGTDGVCLTCDSANHFRELNSSSSRCVPLAGYFDNGVPVCESCPNVCSACSSLTVCSACVSPYFLNTTSSFCETCPYDCLTCGTDGVCLTCDSANHFRQLNSSSSRCVPIAGYFDNNVPVCVSCPSVCSACSSLTVCSACVSPYFLNTTSSFCETCPYDCLTCGTDGICLTCDSVNHFRELNNATSRCVPLPGYYETNTTVAAPCAQGCKTCTPSSCSECSAKFYFDSTNTTCLACSFDCETCDSSGNCLSCNSAVDFRQLNGSRCVPLAGYFESNTTVSGSCSSGCIECLSSTHCIRCYTGYLLHSNQDCRTSCGDRFIENFVNGTCDPCPFDCLTCDSSGNCLSCSANIDFRTINSSSKRCVPMRGFFESSQIVAYGCPSGCYSCSSFANCTSCLNEDDLLKDGRCHSQESASEQSIGMLIGFLFGGAGLAVVGILIVRCIQNRGKDVSISPTQIPPSSDISKQEFNKILKGDVSIQNLD